MGPMRWSQELLATFNCVRWEVRGVCCIKLTCCLHSWNPQISQSKASSHLLSKILFLFCICLFENGLSVYVNKLSVAVFNHIPPPAWVEVRASWLTLYVCVCVYTAVCVSVCVCMCVLAYIIKRVHSGMLLNRTTMIYTMSWCNVRRVILGVMLPKTAFPTGLMRMYCFGVAQKECLQ